MAIDPTSAGTYLKAFEEEISKDVKSLRVGAQVPPGDVNLAYIHTPRINPEGNMSMINTADIYDNIIPSEQKESLVAANAEGKLEYIELINESEIQTRAPETIFPSDNVTITSVFKKKQFTRDSALFYRFELQYHYDSKERTAEKRVLYDGNQIKITDANGNMLSSSYNYEIYITPQALNNRICLVEIYMHNKANEDETFFVQYNHIDRVTQDANIKSVKKKIELYSRKQNIVMENGVVKAMLENGKSRVLNPISAYAASTIGNVAIERNEDEPKNIYAIESRTDKDGYEITVPQKSDIDARSKNAFSFRINVKFFDDKGIERTYTTGFMTNWVLNKEALLVREAVEYSTDFKDISGIIGMTKMDVEEMVIRSLPPNYTTNMNAAEYTIEDDKFNKLYTDIISMDNSEIDCRIVGKDSLKIQAKSNATPSKAWARAELGNVVLKNNRIEHQCTVIAEKQKTYWKFKWEVFAKGTILEEKTRKQEKRDENNEIIYEDIKTIEEVEWDSVTWRRIQGEAEVWYHPDGTYTSVFTPSKLPVKEIEELGVKNLRWTDIIFIEGDKDCGVEIIKDTIRHKMSLAPKTEVIGVPYTLPTDLILKAEGVKKIGEIFGPAAIYDKLKIPTDIPYKDICLRLERGVATVNKLEDIATMDFRLNYRFKVTKGGYEAMPVDQYLKWFGMNRIRLIDYLDENGWLLKDLSVDVVAWTAFEELEIAPIYAIRIEEDRRIDIEMPRVADDKLEHDNWYVRVKNGRMFKTIELPGYDADKGVVPQIYVVYPELIPYAPGLCDTNEVELEYEITEYPNQEFFGYRTMLIEDEQPIILDETTIKVINNPLHLEGEDDKGFIEVKCIRGNKNRILKIADVDSEKGIIYLLDRIHDQDIITVRYVYKELHYTYKGFERFEASQGIVHEEFPFLVEVDATIKMKTEINEVAPTITIEGPDTLVKGNKGTYTVTASHAIEGATYKVDEKWTTLTKLRKSGTTTTPTLIFELEIDSNNYNEDVDPFVYLLGEAQADGITATDTKQIKIIKKPVRPVAKIDKDDTLKWCLDLVPSLIVTGKFTHENKNFTYKVFVNDELKESGEVTDSNEKRITLSLNAADYKGKTSLNVEFVAEAEGYTAKDTKTYTLKECGPDYISHDYQYKIVFEYGDIIENATGLPYEEGDGGALDSYLFFNSKANYVNFQQRTFENKYGKLYLDFDRVSNTKVVDGIAQKEILTIDGFKGKTLTYVIHDYSGFFHDKRKEYTLTEKLTVSVYEVNGDEERLIESATIGEILLPANTNPLVPADFVNAEKKGYYTVCVITIPTEKSISDYLSDGGVTIRNTSGISIPSII